MRRLLPVCLVLALACSTANQAQGQRTFPVAPPDPEAGFEPIFDGKTLSGWEGDSTYWRVEDGALVGEVTPETLLEQNSFIIWRGGTTEDFELKVEYRVSAEGNSGINYRSIEVPEQKWALKGYQADIDGAGRWTGQIYEERGRTFLASRGQFTEVTDDGTPTIRASLGDSTEILSYVEKEDWNEYHLIVRGNVLIHIINNRIMSMSVDNDPEQRRSEGLLGVQVHVGPPMKIEYRNFRLKRR